MSLLSSDILHQVFKFFVSDKQIVDGEALRVASLVCKQWRDVADSKTLWTSSIGENNENKSENDGNDHSSTVHRSLQIKERNGDAINNEIALEASLMGFKKLNCDRGGSTRERELHFRVIERATGKKLLLSMSCEKSKHPWLIRDIYESHFQSKEDFLREPKETHRRRSPLGISVWQGRVVRWYRYESETEDAGTIDRINPRQGTEINNYQKNISSLAEIIRLEKIYLRENNDREKKDTIHYAHRRQHMVDWIVEIAECFGLEDRTIFQAMFLLDRFITSYDRVVSTSSFQLVAGACLLIASKCNTLVITEKDICFCCDNIFSVANIIATEELILKHLEWKLAYPSSTEFMNTFMKMLDVGLDTRMSNLCSYILEMSLTFQTSLEYPPSILAASSLVLARYRLRKNHNIHSLWPEELANSTGLKLDKDLARCAVQLSQDIETARNTTHRLDMINRRNNKPVRHNVAEISLPILTSKTILTDYEELLRSRRIPANNNR